MVAFREWVAQEYERMAAEYRHQLNTISLTCAEWANGNIWEEKHSQAAIECLMKVPVPVISKYPGSVTDEDKAWFRTCLKPDWKQIREYAANEIRKLCRSDIPVNK